MNVQPPETDPRLASAGLSRPAPGLLAELVLLVRLAWPVAIGQLASVSMYLTDNVMVGHVSKVEMAGVAIGVWWFLSVFMPMTGILRILDPIVSQAVGARDEAGAERALARGAVLAGLLALATALCLVATGPVLAAFGQPAEAVAVAVRFSRNLIPGLPATFGFFLLRTWLQARGEMRPGNVAIVLANGLNVLLDWAFVYGHLGSSAMGGAGAGVATSIGSWFQLLIIAGLSVRMWRPSLAYVRDAMAFRSWSRLLPMGLPLGLQTGTEIWAFSAAGWMAGWLGSAALSAHLIAINLASISFNIALGVSTAAATRVGQLVGAGHPIRRTAIAAQLCGLGVMSVFGLVFALIPRQLAQVYSNDPEVIDIAVQLLPIAVAFQLFDGTQVVAFGVLRGAGDVRLPTVFNLVGFWLIGLPLGYWLLVHGGMGVPGVWMGLALALGIVSVLLVLRVRWTVARGGFRV